MRSVAFMLVVVALLAMPGLSYAKDDDTPPMGPEHEAGKLAIAAKDWDGALKALRAAEKREPRNADVHNLLGYTYRNLGQLDLAFKHYERALALNPNHLGAHEYVGEAWLMAGNAAKAEEHLAALKRVCARVCEERDDLEKAIEAYRRRQAASK
jgi:tetratricopeptide (TPR) repeat protein